MVEERERTGLRGKPAGRQARGERAVLEKEGKNVKMVTTVKESFKKNVSPAFS